MMKNGKIEVLRFLFCISVIFFHCARILNIPIQVNLGSISFNFFSHGYIGVEFFFLVSGYFMAGSVNKKQSAGACSDLGRETLEFMKHKVWGIFPYHIAAFVILFIFSVIIDSWGVTEMIANLYKSIPGMLFLQKFGFNFYNLNSVEWYISAMFIAMLVLYPLCRRFYSMFVRVIAPFGGLYISGMLIFRYGSMSGASRWVEGIGFACVLRALAMISLGTCVYEMAKALRERDFTSTVKRIFTTAEILAYGIVFFYVVCDMPGYLEIHCVLLLMGALTLTFSGQTLGTGIFNQGWAYFLGKASLPLYLNQLAALRIVRAYGRVAPLKVQVLLVLFITAVLSFVTFYIGKRIASLGVERHSSEKTSAL